MIVVGIDPGHPMALWPVEALKAYVAGLLDGEGYIGCKRRMPTAANKMSSPKYSVAVSVSMTDIEPVRLVASLLQSEQLVKRRARKAGYKDIYQFDAENDRAAALLEWCKPYLIAKRARADQALRLHGLRSESRQHRTKVIGTHRYAGGPRTGVAYRSFGLSDEFVAQCEAIYTNLLVGSPRSGQAGAWGRR